MAHTKPIHRKVMRRDPICLLYTSGTLDIGTDTTGGTNKSGVDPLFVNAPAAGLSTDGDFHVMPGSPAIDMGLNSANTYPTDLDYNIRIQGASIDIGAYETDGPDCLAFMNQTTVYVDSSATGANTGTSWADAFTDLQDALSVVNTCGVDTVKVAHGTYFPSKTDTLIDECSGAMTIVPVSRSDFFHLPDGITVLGGYPTGGEANGLSLIHIFTSIKFGVMSNDPAGNVCQGGLDTVEIFIGSPLFIMTEEDSICASDSGKLFIEFIPEHIGCEYQLTVYAPNYTATIQENITSTRDSFNIRSFFNTLNVPWDDTCLLYTSINMPNIDNSVQSGFNMKARIFFIFFILILAVGRTWGLLDEFLAGRFLLFSMLGLWALIFVIKLKEYNFTLDVYKRQLLHSLWLSID